MKTNKLGEDDECEKLFIESIKKGADDESLSDKREKMLDAVIGLVGENHPVVEVIKTQIKIQDTEAVKKFLDRFEYKQPSGSNYWYTKEDIVKFMTEEFGEDLTK